MKQFTVAVLLFTALIVVTGCFDKKDPVSALTKAEELAFTGGGTEGAKGDSTNPSGTTLDISDTDKKEAEDTTTTANKALETVLSDISDGNVMDADFSTANKAYKKAIEVNPNNTEAQFGAAVTELALANQIEEANTFYDSLVGEGLFKTRSVPMGISARKIQEAGEILVSMATVDKKELPKISELQKAVKDSILPKITYALNRLSIIENDPDFKFTITPKMLNNKIGDALELDLGEIYMMDASLRLVRGVLLTLIAYNVDIDDNGSYDWAINGNDSIAMVNLKRLYETDSFLALNSYGSNAMKSAIKNFRASIDKIRDGINAIKAERDNQLDDIIKAEYVDDTNKQLKSVGMTGLSTITQALDTIEAVLAGAYTVNIPDVNAKIKVNISAIFDNPIKDLKKKFPYFKWKEPSKWRVVYDKGEEGEYSEIEPVEFTDANGKVLTEKQLDEDGGDFPDYTLGGMFPDMKTKANWKSFVEKFDSDDSNDDNSYEKKAASFFSGNFIK